MELYFKLASTSDIEVLIQLMRELYAHEKLTFDRLAASSACRSILEDDRYGKIYLICLEDDIVGYLALTFGFSLEYHGCDAFVDELYIREKYRRQGIGKRALEFAEDICRDRGVRALHLEVERENIKARAFYSKAGFLDRDRHLLTKWL